MKEIHTVDVNLMRNEEFEEKGIRIKKMNTKFEEKLRRRMIRMEFFLRFLIQEK